MDEEMVIDINISPDTALMEDFLNCEEVIADINISPDTALMEDFLNCEEEIEVVYPVKLTESLNTYISDDVISKEPKKNFKKILIKEVQKHRILYDPFHKKFNYTLLKEEAWKKIAKQLETDVDICKTVWIDLRFDYQRYARRLNKFFSGDIRKNKRPKRRPKMKYETDLIFLWRFINEKHNCPLPFEDDEMMGAEVANTALSSVPEDDDLILVEEEPVIVVIDGDADENTDGMNGDDTFVITKDVRKMLEHIQAYPELYDSKHAYYNDYGRKGIIWNAIAHEVGEKGTKLMKIWIRLQMRYEWELCHPSPDENTAESKNELQKLLDFLSPHILDNPNTVYKHSYFLKHRWYEPIEHFKQIYGLLVAMKNCPSSITLTEQRIKSEQRRKSNDDPEDNSYIGMWSNVQSKTKQLTISPGNCEATWLLLRFFYWELMSMRKHSYQLQDKWYFESIISELYAFQNAINTNSIQTTTSGKTPSNPTPVATAASAVKKSTSNEVSISTDRVSLNFDEDKIASSTITINNNGSQKKSSNAILSSILNTVRPVPSQKTALSQNTVPPLKTAAVRNSAVSILNTAAQFKSVTPPSKFVSAPTPVSLQKSSMQVIPIPPLSTSTQLNPVANPLLPQNHSQNTTMSNQTIIVEQPIISNFGSSTEVGLKTPRIVSAVSLAPRPALQSNQNKGLQIVSVASSGVLPSPNTLNTSITPINVAPSGLVPTSNTLNTSITSVNVASPGLLPTSNTLNPSLTPMNVVRMPASMTPIATTVTPNVSNIAIPMSTSGQPTLISPMTSTMSPITVKPLPPSLLPVSSPMNLPLQTPPLHYTMPENTNFSAVKTPVISSVSGNVNMLSQNKQPATNTDASNSAAPSNLNGNEIMIELISSAAGNQLVVHGPPLGQKYSLSMATTALFIREVMSLPLIHSKHNRHNIARANMYWRYLEKKFQLPIHICKACWNFLCENFKHFPQIAPLEELTKPVKHDWIVWTGSSALATSFNKKTSSLLPHKQTILKIVEEIAERAEYVKTIDGQKKTVYINWQDLSKRYPELGENLPNIWKQFRNVMNQYMSDLEFGIDNKWPQEWWAVLAKMKFVLEERYHNMEPYYYLVRNKMMQEIMRCASIEIGQRQTDSSNEILTIPASSIQKRQTKSSNEILTIPASSIQKIQNKVEVHPFPEPKFNGAELQSLPDINAYNVILAIARHPDVYTKTSAEDKVRAWRLIADELNTTVSSCRLAFQWAIKSYLNYAARDPATRCRVNYRYFKHFAKLYRTIVSPGKINIKTPFEVNNSIHDAAEINESYFPERFIVEINMSDCKPSLVMKNWAYAVNNIYTPYGSLNNAFSKLFEKYRPFAEK